MELEKIAIIISISSFLFSIFTFLYNWNKSRPKVKIDILGCYQYEQDFFLICDISNKSSEPIAIIKSKITNKIRTINSISYSEPFITGGPKIDTTKLPLRIDAFDAKNVIMLLKPEQETEISENDKIKFFTSRGVINKNKLSEQELDLQGTLKLLNLK